MSIAKRPVTTRLVTLHAVVRAALFAVALLVTATAQAQFEDCAQCVLGLFDDPELTQLTGFPTGQAKQLYLGIRYEGDAPVQSLTGIEFGILGLDDFTVVFEAADDPIVVLGTPAVTGVLQQGGMNIAWSGCLPDNRVLGVLTLIPRAAWPTSADLTVTYRHPPGNPNLVAPVLTQCNDPVFTGTRISGGTYVLAAPGNPICNATAGNRDFGAVPQGSGSDITFHVTNAGSGVLSGVVEETCEDFSILENPAYALPAGEQKAYTLRFSPRRPGPQVCTVLTGTSCAPLDFIGTTAPITEIAEIHNDPGSSGRTVTVEAQVYIPTNYSSQLEGWIQDTSGRGVRIAGVGVEVAPLRQLGNRVRVTGRVRSSGRTLSLDPVSVVTLIRGGAFDLRPRVLPTAVAASHVWEGTYVQVTAPIVSISGQTHYWLDDGSGHVAARVRPEVGAAAFEVGQTLTARGAGGHWSGDDVIHVARPDDLYESPAQSCLGRALVIDGTRVTPGSIVDIPILMQWNEEPVDALGFRLDYDPTVVRFLAAECCGLTDGWFACETRVTSPGSLTLGAFDPTPIPANSSGNIMCLRFEFIGCGSAQLTLWDLVDDVAGFDVCNGTFECVECLSDGDVNADAQLTPGDAQCAFQVFLNNQGPPDDCAVNPGCAVLAADVDCSELVTPGDALEIFRRWMGGNSTPQDCFAGRQPKADLPHAHTGATLFELDVEAAERDGSGHTRVPLRARHGAGAAAFALALEHDPSLRFVELRAEPKSMRRWKALDARRHPATPGGAQPRLLVGGYSVGDPTAAAGQSGWETFAWLVFDTSGRPLGLGHLTWLEQRIDGVVAGTDPGSTSPNVLGQPAPNPVAGETRIDVNIPGVGDRVIEVTVHDVHGRRIRTLHRGTLPAGPHRLHWDRLDARGDRVAAGIYVVRLRSGEHLENRKIVVLQ